MYVKWGRLVATFADYVDIFHTAHLESTREILNRLVFVWLAEFGSRHFFLLLDACTLGSLKNKSRAE